MSGTLDAAREARTAVGRVRPQAVATLRSFDSEQMGHRVQALGISDARALGEVRDLLGSFVEKVGFVVGAFAVRRSDDHLQVAVVVGTDLVDEDLIRMVIPPHSWSDLFSDSEVHGSWHLRRWTGDDPSQRAYSWVPDTPVRDEPGAWRPLDGLHYPVRDGEGEIVAVIGLDVPVDGLAPTGTQWDRLNDLTDFAAPAINAILARERQAERARFAETAQAVLRRISADVPPLEALRQAAPSIEAGLSVDEVACHLFTEPAETALASVIALCEQAVLACWRSGASALEIVTSEAGSVRAAVGDDAAGVRLRATLEQHQIHRALLVPVGVGSACYGGLLVARTVVRAPWGETESRALAEIGGDLGRSIAAERAQERERQLLLDLQRVADYKTRLVATVTHDLVSPISAIRLHLDLLEQERTGHEAEIMLRAVSVMKRASQELLDSVEGLLALYRADAARTPRERIDLRALVHDAVEVHRPIAKKAGLVLREESVGMGAVPVAGNRAELGRVLANLIGNAVKYTPVGAVSVCLGEYDGWALFCCRDTGVGMSQSDQGRIFEEFFRSDDPRVRDVPGTGLGMSIVARIVESHGGTVQVQSAPGEGTRVEVRLPLSR